MDSGYADRLRGCMLKTSTPPTSPLSTSKQQQLCYYDRYIPSRASPIAVKKCLFGSPMKKLMPNKSKDDASEPPKPEVIAFEIALKNELLGSSISEIPDPQLSGMQGGDYPSSHTPASHTPSPLRENMLKFMSPRKKRLGVSPYSKSPISAATSQMLLSPRRATRKIPKTPFKVLDAPDLQDDYYLNLLDWSGQNVLAVGLGTAVYMWNASTCQVSKLCDLDEERNSVTSVSWSQSGQYLSVGTHKGCVHLWDVANVKRTATLNGHSGRVGSLSWCDDHVTSGSRDNSILQWDPRLPAFPTRRLLGHAQEVCGLKWSPDQRHLASGGNDNKLLIWSHASNTPIHCLSEHRAAVKALAWSPHQHGLLSSGGGTADKTIRFWNGLTGNCLQSIDTGSQVCNLAWSVSSNELVSTHGYSQNQINIWQYPSLLQAAKLTGHTTRVLYLAMSPDGQTIVTGAGDETLRFWNVFAKSKSFKKACSPLDMASYVR